MSNLYVHAMYEMQHLALVLYARTSPNINVMLHNYLLWMFNLTALLEYMIALLEYIEIFYEIG